MHKYTEEHLAKEAERLGNDEILCRAIDDARKAALEELAITDPTDSVAIMKQQAVIHALEGTTAMLERYILAQV